MPICAATVESEGHTFGGPGDRKHYIVQILGALGNAYALSECKHRHEDGDPEHYWITRICRYEEEVQSYMGLHYLHSRRAWVRIAAQALRRRTQALRQRTSRADCLRCAQVHRLMQGELDF